MKTAGVFDTPGERHWQHRAHPRHGRKWPDLEPLYRQIAEQEAQHCAVCANERTTP